MTARASVPLAASYFAFFLPAGVLLSYLPPFLAGKGLQAPEVGLIFSAVFAVKLVTGPMLAWWADQVQRQQLLLAVAAWASVACGILLAVSERFDVVFASVICIAVCRNYFQCTLEALATRVKNAGGAPRYGLMRGCGSASVCLGVVLFGGLWSANKAYQHVLLPLMILASGCVLIVCLRAVGVASAVAAASGAAATVATAGPAPARVRATSVLLLLAGATLLIGANGVFYSTATLLMAQRGVSSAGIALLWFAAFGIEALGFAAFDRLRAWCGAKWLFAAAVALALARWVLFAQCGGLAWMAVAFALHVASFSWLHAFCANWVRDSGPAKFAVTAQAIYTACAHGVGMAAAAYAASLLLLRLGSGVYWIAAAMTLTGALALGLRAALGAARGTMRTEYPMRDPNQIAELLSDKIQRTCFNALAVAIGGSHSTAQQDDQSDLDLVVLFEDGPLIEQSAELARVLLPLIEEPVQLVGGPSWKEGFGCRTSVLYGDGFKVEIFAVTADTAPVVDRVLRWQPLWGHRPLHTMQQSVQVRLTPEHILAKARFDTAYAHMSVCRHLARAELFAARHVLTSFVAIALALRLHELGHPYDTVTSYKRILRDGLDGDAGVRVIEHASCLLGGGAEQLRSCLQMLADSSWRSLDALGGSSEQAARLQVQLRAISEVPQRWLVATA